MRSRLSALIHAYAMAPRAGLRLHLQHLRYMLRHKWFVFVAGRALHVPIWRLVIHDWSKFTPSEWTPYAVRLADGTEDERWVAASLRHLHRNPHHWQHWVVGRDSGTLWFVEMPDHFVREMVADWMAATRARTGAWGRRATYVEKIARFHLHPSTRQRLEQLIGVLPLVAE